MQPSEVACHIHIDNTEDGVATLANIHLASMYTMLGEKL